jgi:putative membrane protein
MNAEHTWMWWPWSGMWIFPIVMCVIMLIFIFLFFGRWGCRPPWWGPGGHYRESGDSETALEILKKRYAKGEINNKEFEQMKKDIMS